MAYLIEIIPKEKQSTSTWSGGTTTQLAIYPTNSDYKAQNFKWRLSSASVEVEESTFSSLPDIWRHIMIIEGEMELRHEGHHSALLKPFDQDSFSGSWTTRSIGRARDFNLMLSVGCRGELEAIFVGKSLKVEAEAGSPVIGFLYLTDAFYCAAGTVKVSANNEQSYELYQGELMLIHGMVSDEYGKIGLQCTGQSDAAVIRARISYK